MYGFIYSSISEGEFPPSIQSIPGTNIQGPISLGCGLILDLQNWAWPLLPCLPSVLRGDTEP